MTRTDWRSPAWERKGNTVNTKSVGLAYVGLLFLLCVLILWSPGPGDVATRATALLDTLLEPVVLTAMLAAIGGEKIAPEVKRVLAKKADNGGAQRRRDDGPQNNEAL